MRTRIGVGSSRQSVAEGTNIVVGSSQSEAKVSNG